MRRREVRQAEGEYLDRLAHPLLIAEQPATRLAIRDARSELLVLQTFDELWLVAVGVDAEHGEGRLYDVLAPAGQALRSHRPRIERREEPVDDLVLLAVVAQPTAAQRATQLVDRMARDRL